jgi:hypothetical protein
MNSLKFAFAALFALPLPSAASAQAPAPVDIESVQPISGAWTYRAIAGGSEADFVDAASAVRMEIRCNRSARTVSIVRTGVPAAAPSLAIWTTSLTRTIPARYLATKELIADVAASDPLLDAIAFSDGRFATAATGAPMTAVPAWPEVARVVEDCRS